mgnify:CR=1 FL=1
MNRSELRKLSRRELYEMAKAYDLSGRSRMTKDELVESLSRVSAKKVMPKPKPPKRRMSKRRVRKRRVAVRTTAGRSRKATPGSKMEAPAPHAQRPQVYVDRGPELPGSYRQDKVYAMVRDPNWIYAYWDLSGGARERVTATAPGGAWVLRVNNLSDSVFDDVPVLIESGNWYVPVASDTEYNVEIGLLGTDGRFHAAASSRSVRTPRMGISQLVDEQWLILEDEFQRLMEFSDGLATRFSGSRFLSEVITGRHRLAGMHSAGVSSLGGSKRK